MPETTETNALAGALERLWIRLDTHYPPERGWTDDDSAVIRLGVLRHIRSLLAASPPVGGERYQQACGHHHGFDPCLLVRGHTNPHFMLDHDYPAQGPRRREYVCELHPVALPVPPQDDALRLHAVVRRFVEAIDAGDLLASNLGGWDDYADVVMEARALAARAPHSPTPTEEVEA